MRWTCWMVLGLTGVLWGGTTACRAPSGGAGGAPNRYADITEREEFKIENAVYRYLFGLGFWQHQPYSAVFLAESDREVKARMEAFPNHVPKIKPSSQASLLPQSTPIDKETGSPAVILAATAAEPAGDRAHAVGSYYAGALIRGRFAFSVRNTDGQWTIESVKEMPYQAP
jgi:hypothetical protein